MHYFVLWLPLHSCTLLNSLKNYHHLILIIYPSLPPLLIPRPYSVGSSSAILCFCPPTTKSYLWPDQISWHIWSPNTIVQLWFLASCPIPSHHQLFCSLCQYCTCTLLALELVLLVIHILFLSTFEGVAMFKRGREHEAMSMHLGFQEPGNRASCSAPGQWTKLNIHQEQISWFT